MRRNKGFINHLPETIKPTTAASAMPIDIQSVVCFASAEFGTKKAIDAKSGTIAKSSKISVDITRCPFGVLVIPRSSKVCITIAVEDKVNPIPAIKATSFERLSK